METQNSPETDTYPAQKNICLHSLTEELSILNKNSIVLFPVYIIEQITNSFVRKYIRI